MLLTILEAVFTAIVGLGCLAGLAFIILGFASLADF